MAATVPAPIAACQALDVIVGTDSTPSTPVLTESKEAVAPAPVASVTSAARAARTPIQTGNTKQLGMIRFRVPKKSECFIAPGPETYDGMISLIKRECPSLVSWPADKLTLHVSFDSSASNAEGVMFRVLPECWPGAITESLKLVVVRKVTVGVDAESGIIPSRNVKAICEMSERERLAFSEEMPDSIGTSRSLEGQFSGRIEGSSLTQELAPTWDQAVQQQVLLGDGQQVSSSTMPLANALAQGVPDVPISTWEEAAEQGIALGDGQQVSATTGPMPAACQTTSTTRLHLRNDAGDIVANSWRDAVQNQVLLADH